MSFQNTQNGSMSTQQGYMTNPPPTTPSNGSQFPSECANQFRGHPYQAYPNQECPPDMPASNVAVSQSGHGQALTLNQLLLQNNSPGPQPPRVSGPISPMGQPGGFRYDPYGYMPKSGPSGQQQDGNQPLSGPPISLKDPATQESLLRSSRANTPQEGAPDMRSPVSQPDQQQQMDSMPKSQPNRTPGGPSPLPGYGPGMPQDTRMNPGMVRPGVMGPGAFPPRSSYPPEYGQDPYAPYPLQRYPPPPQSSRYPAPGGGYSMMPPPPPPTSSGYPPPPPAEYQKMWPYMMPDHPNYPRPYHPDMYSRGGGGYPQPPPMSNGLSSPRGPTMRYPHPPMGSMESVVPPSQPPNSQQDQSPGNFPPSQQTNRADSRDEAMSSRISCSNEQTPTSSAPPGEVIPLRPPSSSLASVRTGPPPSPKKEDDQQHQQQPPPQNAMPQHHQFMMQQQQQPQMHPMYRQGQNRMPPRGPHPGGAYGYPGYPPNFPQQPQQQQYPPQQQQPYSGGGGGDMSPNAIYHQPHPQPSYGHLQQQSGGPPPQYPYHRGYPPQAAPPPPQSMHSIAPPPNLSPQSASCFSRLMEMGYEPDRRQWLEHYFFFMEEINKPLTGLPQVVKQPLDLYRFYLAVRERGGVLEVIKTKRWKEISQLFNINASASAAYTLRKNYCKYLLDYECRFDHGPGGADVRVVAAQIETLSGKKKKPSVGSIGGGGAGSEMNESSTSSSTPFPPPSPVGSQSSASSNLMPPVQQPPSNGAPTSVSATPAASVGGTDDGGGGGAKTVVGPGSSPVAGGGISPAPSSAAASPYPAPQATATTTPSSTPVAASVEQQQQLQSPSGYPMGPGGGSPWRPSVGANQRPPFPPPGYPQSRMPGPGVSYGCEMVGRHPYPPPPSPYGRLSSGSTGGSHLMAAMEGMRGEASPEGAPLLSSKPPTGNTVHHPPQQQPQPPPSMMYQRGPPYMIGQHHHHPPPPPQQQQPPPPPSFTAHYQPPPPPSGGQGPGGRSGMAMGQRPPMSPFVGAPPGYTNASGGSQPPNTAFPSSQRLHHPQSAMMAQQQQQQQQQPPPPHPGMMPQQRPGPAYVTAAAAAAAYWKRLEAVQFFPPGCVEATPIDASRRKRFRIKDLGPLTASKLVMALRSGLPSETTWALNALNVILRDEPNALEAYFAPPTQQPLVSINANAPTLNTLVTALTDHLRHDANELFPSHRLTSELELPLHLDAESQLICKTPPAPADPPPLDIQTSSSSSSSTSSTTNRENLFTDLFNEISSKCRCLRVRNPPLSPNGLVSLEHEIVAMANSKGVSVGALREAIRQLLQGSGKNARLLMKASAPKLPKTAPSMDSGSDKSGTGAGGAGSLNKRGRGRGSGTSLLADHLAAFEAAHMTPATTIAKHTTSLLVNNLSGPEARSNIRRLALFALDELLEGKESPPPVLLPADVAAELTSPPASPRPPSMRDVFMRGGSDSTSYILPHPNGCGGSSNSSTGSSASMRRKRTNSSTEATSTSDKASKRARSSSSSSSLPVLSPQKVDPSTDKTDIASTPPAEAMEEDEDSELNSHRLMTDSRGYCPLRARSEIIRRGDLALWPVDAASERAEGFALRCLCVSTVLRNLSFLPSCERVLANHKALLALTGRLLTVAHTHFESADADWACVEDHMTRYDSNSAWWMPWLDELCENILVLLVNILGHLQCLPLHESIVRPLLEGLVHWATCQTAAATDPLPGHRIISPCRLALEALNRLAVNDSNVAMLLATMDTESACRLFDRLASWLALPEDQVTRELALSTLHYLSEPPVNICQQQIDGNNTSTYGLSFIAQAKPCPIAGLISFIEVMETKTRRVIEQYGVQVLQDQPELMGTSLELLRRAGALLQRLAANSFGRSRFTPDLEMRVLGLATSRVLDATVAQLLSGCLLDLPQRDSHSVSICDLIPKMPSSEKVAQLLAPLLKRKEVADRAVMQKVLEKEAGESRRSQLETSTQDASSSTRATEDEGEGSATKKKSPETTVNPELVAAV
ncbi:Trithorax group protein osa [Echinococcus granulosus]|uniref:AT rich interactive domain containing protein 1 n=1 Tax=Echinococcus granulosus TaxID=6210 RepID=A0A068X348_ECHGR|nr:Trithorax group protein osa [Echinococcus granulosus]CDS24404.1 AT rich interactive domain containing protein 1 [Echinococcus granulosus]